MTEQEQDLMPQRITREVFMAMLIYQKMSILNQVVNGTLECSTGQTVLMALDNTQRMVEDAEAQDLYLYFFSDAEGGVHFSMEPKKHLGFE